MDNRETRWRRSAGRRAFVSKLCAGGALLWLPGLAPATTASAVQVSSRSQNEKEDEEEVAPPEDLMREHGVLKRVLLVYREAITRLETQKDLPPEAVQEGATIIRTFIEDYHEKLEEDYLFPRFEKAGRLADLTAVLRAQHQAGRRLTEEITQRANARALKNAAESSRLREAMQQFVRMYEPHEAREDTVLFPALREVVSGHEFGALGEDFEKKEHQLFGQDGFEKMVDRVARIEKTLGIYDLAQFTPKV